MRWQHVVVAGLALAAAAARADDPAIGDFSGSWHGTELQISGDHGGLALAPEDLDAQIRGAGTGFQISWTSLSRQPGGGLAPQPTEARFVQTDRPGVYAFDPGDTSLLARLFADPATGNPLQGETLLWARLAGPTLTVYSLAIGLDGGFTLERYARSLSDGGLDIHYTHRVENDRVVTIQGRVTAKGG